VQISAADYPALKAFFAWTTEHLVPPTPGLLPEQRPIAVLEGFEARSPAMARKGLAMAIGDLMEMTQDLPRPQVTTIDEALRAAKIITLSEVRARFWTKIRRMLERGAVRSETDYYALRNTVEALPEGEQATGWDLLSDYEQRAAVPR
jgi:hypothetical protein